MSENDRGMSLSQATEIALRSFGIDILKKPRRFLAFVIDCLNPDAVEILVLERHCDAQLLDPYWELAKGRMKPDEAAARTEMYLTHEHLIAVEPSIMVSRGLAGGVAAYLGIAGLGEMPRADSIVDSSSADAAMANTPRQSDTTPVPVDAIPSESVPNESELTTSNKGEVYGPSGRDSSRRLRTVVTTIIGAVVVLAVVVVGFSSAGGFDIGQSGLVEAVSKKEESGKWLLAEQVTKNAKGEVTYEERNKYDEHGNLASSRSQREGYMQETGYWYVWEYGGYDEYGHCHSMVLSDVYEDGQIKGAQLKYTYEYDLFDDGRIRSKVERRDAAEGKDPRTGSTSIVEARIGTIEYTYDDAVLTKVYERQVVPDDDSDVTTYEVHYDTYGHVTYWNAEYSFSPDYSEVRKSSNKSEDDYELDADGTILRCIDTTTDVSEEGETTVKVTESEYDEHENVTKETKTSDGEQTVTEYENSYDEHGNLIKRENLTDGEVTTYSYVYIAHPSPVAAGDIVNW